jgi:hypothetical protein
MVMMDINEGVDDTITIVVQVGMIVTSKVVGNTCQPSSLSEFNLQGMCISMC